MSDDNPEGAAPEPQAAFEWRETKLDREGPRTFVAETKDGVVIGLAVSRYEAENPLGEPKTHFSVEAIGADGEWRTLSSSLEDGYHTSNGATRALLAQLRENSTAEREIAHRAAREAPPARPKRDTSTLRERTQHMAAHKYDRPDMSPPSDAERKAVAPPVNEAGEQVDRDRRAANEIGRAGGLRARLAEVARQRSEGARHRADAIRRGDK